METIKEILCENINSYYGRTLFDSVFSGAGMNSGFVFRGESSEYTLVPSVLRIENREKLKLMQGTILSDKDWLAEQVSAEFSLLRKFYRHSNHNGLYVPHVPEFEGEDLTRIPIEQLEDSKPRDWLGKTFEDLAALAQHYGVMTRMLDWSYDLRVALYFACVGVINRWSKGNVPAENQFMVIWGLNTLKLFTWNTNRENEYVPLRVVVPRYSENPNLNAQKGVLTYWNINTRLVGAAYIDSFQGNEQEKTDRRPLNELIEDAISELPFTPFTRVRIPAREAVRLYHLLDRDGYNAARLFPGYNGIKMELEEKASIKKIESM